MKVSIPDQCADHRKVERIVCAEQGRKITFLNPKKRPVVKYSIDSCAPLRRHLADGTCKLCDFVVIDWRKDEHYVELKGRNVGHALKQLESTILQLRSEGAVGVVYCWIITTASPSNTAKSLNRKAQFKKRFKARLEIRTNQHVHSLESS
jgi:hypothetical protein